MHLHHRRVLITLNPTVRLVGPAFDGQPVAGGAGETLGMLRVKLFSPARVDSGERLAGQLLVVAILGLLARPGSKATERAPWLRTAFIYAMGITAAYWSIERLFVLIQGA